MANENVGEIDCEIHIRGYIRKDKKNKLYIYAPEFGIIGPKAAPFQLVIKEKATMYGTPETDYKGGGEPAEPSNSPEGAEKPEPETLEEIPETKTQAAPEPPETPPKKGGFGSALKSWLNEE